MPTFPARRFTPSSLVLIAAVCFVACNGEQPAEARPQDNKAEKWKDLKYEEAKACKRCHNAPDADSSVDVALLTEYPIWKTLDRHAQAYAVLAGPRGQRMSELMFGKDKKDVVLKEEGGCLSCHAMNIRGPDGKAQEGLDMHDGVSCGGCHGPSSKWNAEHYKYENKKYTWRDKSAAEKETWGMADLRDPVRRAQLCVSCHIGNVSEGKVVTHAMYAAGHPPLPAMEIANFSRNLPQHWRDPEFVPYFKMNAANQKVIENYHLESPQFQRSRTALAGSVVSLRESLGLARDRSDFAAKNADWTWWPEVRDTLNGADAADNAKVKKEAESRWPEIAMTHSDCYACHHDLRYPGFRQARGFGYHLPGREPIRVVPGRPVVRPWPLGAVELTVISLTGDKKVPVEPFTKALEDLAAKTSKRPYGEPKELHDSLDALVKWCDGVIEIVNDPKQYNERNVDHFIQQLSKFFDPNDPKGMVPDFETARQAASVLKVLYEDRLLGKDPTIAKYNETEAKMDKIFADLDKSLALKPFFTRDRRTKVILDVVKQKVNFSDEAAVKAFTDFAANVNAGDPRTLADNKFVDALRAKLSNEQFTAGLTDEKVVKALQELGDEEARAMLKAIADYDPDVFKKQIAAVAKNAPK
jgi:hypothetical protein